MVRHPVLVRQHADDFVAFHFRLERTSDAAVTASGGHGAIGRAFFDVDFSTSASVGQACTQAPHETHSDSKNG